MPLKPGTSNKVKSENIKETMDSYSSSGKIGTSAPKTRRQALRQAIAVAYSKARGGKKRAKSGKK